jgi:CoA-transferase family III
MRADRERPARLAGGIAAALYQRATTGEGAEVDASLLGVGLWANGATTALSLHMDQPWVASPVAEDCSVPGNPLFGAYRTRDGRWLFLCMPRFDAWWPEVCRCVDREDLIDDPRFIPVGRLRTPADCAYLVGVLASDAAGYLTGAVIPDRWRWTVSDARRTFLGREGAGPDDEHGRLSRAEPIYVGELGVARGRRRGEPAGLVQRSQNRSVCAVAAAGLAEACGPLHRRVRFASPPETFDGVPTCGTRRAVGDIAQRRRDRYVVVHHSQLARQHDTAAGQLTGPGIASCHGRCEQYRVCTLRFSCGDC